MRSPALISVYPNTGCHAVLALLSEGYPPLEGRSPTRYSPVCHSTYPLRDFRVRLACIRHAASVDSEPGSNSQVKGVGPSHAPSGARPGHNSINPRSLTFGSSDSSQLPSVRRGFLPAGPRIPPRNARRPAHVKCEAVHPSAPPRDRAIRMLPADTRRAVLARSI